MYICNLATLNTYVYLKPSFMILNKHCEFPTHTYKFQRLLPIQIRFGVANHNIHFLTLLGMWSIVRAGNKAWCGVYNSSYNSSVRLFCSCCHHFGCHKL